MPSIALSGSGGHNNFLDDTLGGILILVLHDWSLKEANTLGGQTSKKKIGKKGLQKRFG